MSAFVECATLFFVGYGGFRLFDDLRTIVRQVRKLRMLRRELRGLR